jgi:hypothetical protein
MLPTGSVVYTQGRARARLATIGHRLQEQVFAKLDEDKNGKIEGPEFSGVLESGMFNVLPPEKFQK